MKSLVFSLARLVFPARTPRRITIAVWGCHPRKLASNRIIQNDAFHKLMQAIGL
jgi:hypothetical protein